MGNPEFSACVQVYFKLHPQEKKYESDANVQAIVARMKSFGLAVPSETMVARAIAELVAEEEIVRVDGSDAEMDRIAEGMASRARIDRLASAPLKTADFEKFSSMSTADVAAAYYTDNLFAARYRLAAAKWMFKLPGKPASTTADVPAESDTSQWRSLDAKTYHSMRAMQITALYRKDSGFKRAVDRLIKNGLIIVLIGIALQSLKAA